MRVDSSIFHAYTHNTTLAWEILQTIYIIFSDLPGQIGTWSRNHAFLSAPPSYSPNKFTLRK